MNNRTKQLIVLAFAVLIVAAYYLPLKEWAEFAYDWTLAYPRAGAAGFLLLFVVWVVLALPASVLVLAGGFVFGLAPAFGLVFLGGFLKELTMASISPAACNE